MSIKLYNSLSNKVETILKEQQKSFNMYVCGITVYDSMHLGHARVYLVFDLLYRLLKNLNIDVKYIRNITDIDDKIINKASSLGVDWQELVTKNIEDMQALMAKMSLLQPDQQPRATEHIKQIIKLTQNLIAKDHAYQTSSGNVYFRVSSFPNYGMLSKRKLDSALQGTRVDHEDDKESNHDFALWKSTEAPNWPSPFGPGRPGWHIECSAMIESAVQGVLDLHGGGNDLKFPHHENEIAQSCCSFGHEFVRHWMHVGFVLLNGEKMSKSTGNFIPLREILSKYSPDVLRYYMYSTHYRSPLNFTIEGLDSAKRSLAKLYNAFKEKGYTKIRLESVEYLEHDLNTSKCLSALHEILNNYNKNKDQSLLDKLGSMLELLGFNPKNADEFFKAGQTSLSEKQIEDMISKRQIAKDNKDFSTADQIREELLKHNIVIEDSATGTSWRKS